MEDFWSPELVDELKETENESDEIRLYVAGPVFDYSASDRLRDSVVERCEMYSFITPVDPLEKEPDDREGIPPADVETLSTCDAVLLYHVEGAESWGTAAELYLAAMADYPIFLWETDEQMPPLSVWLESALEGQYVQLADALSAVQTSVDVE